MGDSAEEGVDYAAVDDFMLRIPAGSSSGTEPFTLTPTDDMLFEGDESISVSGAASGLTVTAARLALTENDARPRISLSLNFASRAESAGGAQSVTVTATLLETSPGVVVTLPEETVVTVTVGGGSSTAVSGTDYATVDDFTVRIPAEASSGMAPFDLTPIDDAVFEGPELIFVRGTATGFAVSPAFYTLNDDETAPTGITLSVSPSMVEEDAGGAQSVTVTATLEGSVTLAVDTDVTVSVGGAGSTASSGTDYATVDDFMVTILAESSSGAAPFSLTPTNDALDEDDETITVSGAATDFTVTPATLTLTDDDLEPSLLPVSDVTGFEDMSPLTFTVELAAASGKEVRVGYATTGGTATEGTDYERAADTLVFAAGETSKQIPVTVLDDDLDEDDESFTLTLTSAVNATLPGDRMATGTITDNDNLPVLSVDESDGDGRYGPEVQCGVARGEREGGACGLCDHGRHGERGHGRRFGLCRGVRHIGLPRGRDRQGVRGARAG